MIELNTFLQDNLKSTKMKNLKMVAFFFIMACFSCSKDDNEEKIVFQETQINLTSHKLTAFSVIKNSKYLIVFESGLGDDHSVWQEKDVAYEMAKSSDVLLYDRAGYGKSETNNSPRNIFKLRTELEQVIDNVSNGRKVILVGHSLGGMIIRDYAIHNPIKTAGLVFVDASHEMFNNPTQSEEDQIFSYYNSTYEKNFGATIESRELVEDTQYMTTLSNLPNIPVIAITSMKIDAAHNAADRQLWYNSKEALKTGVTDFTHITTTKSGHYIMLEEPFLVIEKIKSILSRLP